MTKKSILRLLQASLMCCLAVLFTACDDIFASEDNPIPAYLSMSDKPVTIKAGDTYRRKAISVTSAVVEYTSSKTDVATVDNERAQLPSPPPLQAIAVRMARKSTSPLRYRMW